MTHVVIGKAIDSQNSSVGKAVNNQPRWNPRLMKTATATLGLMAAVDVFRLAEARPVSAASISTVPVAPAPAPAAPPVPAPAIGAAPSYCTYSNAVEAFDKLPQPEQLGTYACPNGGFYTVQDVQNGATSGELQACASGSFVFDGLFKVDQPSVENFFSATYTVDISGSLSQPNCLIQRAGPDGYFFCGLDVLELLTDCIPASTAAANGPQQYYR